SCMKKILTFVLFFSIRFCLASSTGTGSDGNWSDSAVWNGKLNPFAFDTVIVSHHVEFLTDLTIDSGKCLIIETVGKLCGHFNLIISKGGKLVDRGALFAHAIYIPGGEGLVTGGLFTEGEVILTVTGAKLECANGGMMIVGVKFDCSTFTYTPKDTTKFYTRT